MKPNIVCVSLFQKGSPQTSKCPKNQRQTVRGRLKKIHAIPFNSMQYNAISLHWQNTVPVCKAVIFTDKVALINCLQESREIFSCGRCPDVQTSSYTIVRINTSLTKTKGTSKSTHLCARNRWDPSKPQILLCFQRWKRGSLHWLNRSHRVHPMQLLEMCTDYNLFQTRWELKYLYKFPKAFSQIFHVPVFSPSKGGWASV